MLCQELGNSEEETEDVKNKLQEAKADISRCWIKYCVNFLEHSSKKLILREVEAELERLGEKTDKSPKITFNIDDSGFQDESLAEIPIKPVETLVQANKVHQIVLKLFDTATKYFKIDGWVTDHVEVTQDMSRAWKFLSEFDTNFERRCKMHKRRIDLLTPILSEINSQFYLQICRQLQYEIGEIYSEMTDFKIAVAEQEDQPSLQRIRKINVLANCGLKIFKSFMDSMREPDKSWPKEFDPLLVRPFLMANFHSARLYSKLITIKRAERIEWTQASWSHYKLILQVCENDSNAQNEIRDELPLVVEMDALMPQKLSQIAQSPSLQ